MNIQIRVDGDEELVRKLNQQTTIRAELLRAGDKAAAVMHRRASTYPPARPSSTYTRTNTLMKRWATSVRPFGGGVIAYVRNPTEYGQWVKDPERQAGVHQGRWPTTRQDLREMQQKITGFFETALANIRRALGR